MSPWRTATSTAVKGLGAMDEKAALLPPPVIVNGVGVPTGNDSKSDDCAASAAGPASASRSASGSASGSASEAASGTGAGETWRDMAVLLRRRVRGRVPTGAVRSGRDYRGEVRWPFPDRPLRVQPSRGPMRPLAVALLLATAARAAAQSSGIRTYANPLDVDYKYNFEQEHQGISYRSGADPVIVNHKGEYFLFGTTANGYWHSTDLVRWRFVTPSRWPFEDVVAPAAISVGDTLLLMQSATAPRPLLYSTDPASGRLE